MKKITLLILILFSLSAQRYAMSQITTEIGSFNFNGPAIGSEVIIPITVTTTSPTNVGTIDLVVNYDPAVAYPILVSKGTALLTGGVFKFNNQSPGVLLIGWSFGNKDFPVGISDLAYVTFKKVSTGATVLSFETINCAYGDHTGTISYNECEYISGSLEFTMNAPHTSLPVVPLCASEIDQTVIVPIVVSNFYDISTISLSLNYNPLVLEYLTASEDPGSFTYMSTYGDTPGRVGISIINFEEVGITYPAGTIISTLTFKYLGGSTDITFNEAVGTCEYTNIANEKLIQVPFEAYYTNGFVGATESTWTGATSTAWENIANWSCALPTIDIDVTIGTSTNNNYPVISSAANAKSLTISAGSVTISPTFSLTVANELTNSMGNSGLVIKSDYSGTGSLIHTTGDVPGTVERFISGSANLGDFLYHQVSVPLAQSSNPTSNLFLDSYLFDFNEGGGGDDASGEWNPLGESTNTALDVNKGYLIYYPNTDNTYTFEGPLRAGAVSPAIAFTDDGNHGFNLVPNPYPSAIDWELTTRENLDAGFWIWNSAGPNYGAYSPGTESGILETTKYIPVGQSFFVRAIAGGAPLFTMENADRVHNTQPFLKNTKTIENQLHLIANGNHSRDEIIVAFNDNWSAATDAADVTKMYGNDGAPQLNTVASDGSKLSIDARNFTGKDVIVPLDFSLTETTEVTFTASGIETFNLDTPIFLEDLTLNTLTDLRTSPAYTFQHSEGNNNDRFRLVFKGSLGISKPSATTEGKVFVNAGMLYIDISDMQQTKASIAIYDATGRQLSSRIEVIHGQVQMAAPSAPGMYIVRVSGGSKTFTGKVVVN